ncbi:hypothetical protein Pmani_015625 [Petrolisthes manimaculis]|uniref:Uncharacterized protein n=1 Tax=Petrolisthes manimaculis TaxID=1843537 RepID=A0AAE1PS04_9EUCA|nr:hypothetical protein Pmani_015625 [Petrolisthes manimaculis]
MVGVWHTVDFSRLVATQVTCFGYGLPNVRMKSEFDIYEDTKIFVGNTRDGDTHGPDRPVKEETSDPTQQGPRDAYIT